MTKPKVIFIDLDGVLVDLHDGLIRLFGDDPAKYTPAQLAEVGEWGLSIPSVEGKFKSPGDFWDKVRVQGIQWWVNLPKFSWTDELWDAAKSTGATVAVLTTPAPFPECVYGKYQWVKDNLHTDSMLIGRPKEVCAAGGAWLIDDRAGYGPRWEGNGGRLISFKREWNPGGMSIDEVLKLLREVNS